MLSVSDICEGEEGGGEVGGEVGVLGANLTCDLFSSGVWSGEYGGEPLSSLASFFLNMLEKIDVRLSFFLASAAAFFLLSSRISSSCLSVLLDVDGDGADVTR